MARKGVLVSNPDVKNMTKTQWMLEYEGIKRKEEGLFKASFTALRQTLVSTLGLNIIRPVNENGLPKATKDMSQEELDAFLPLVAWCARTDMLKPVVNQFEADAGIEKATNPDAAYEEMVNAIDAADGDMEPIIGIEIGAGGKVLDPRLEQQKKLFVQQEPIIDLDGKV